MFLIGAAFFGMWYFLTLYYQEVLGWSALRTGFAFVPQTFAIIIGAQLASRLLARVGAWPLILAGTGAATVGFWALAHLTTTSSYFGFIMWPAILITLGRFAVGGDDELVRTVLLPHELVAVPSSAGRSALVEQAAAQLEEYLRGARRESSVPHPQQAPRSRSGSGACWQRSPTARPSPTTGWPTASVGPELPERRARPSGAILCPSSGPATAWWPPTGSAATAAASHSRPR